MRLFCFSSPHSCRLFTSTIAASGRHRRKANANAARAGRARSSRPDAEPQFHLPICSVSFSHNVAFSRRRACGRPRTDLRLLTLNGSPHASVTVGYNAWLGKRATASVPATLFFSGVCGAHGDGRSTGPSTPARRINAPLSIYSGTPEQLDSQAQCAERPSAGNPYPSVRRSPLASAAGTQRNV
jgi:hypothetical protein